MSDVPQIYKAIVGVMQDIGAIEKNSTNPYDKYKYRGIDDVYNNLQQALIKNGVVIKPELLDIVQLDRTSKKGEPMVHTRVTVKYQVACAADGSSIDVVFPGENMDRSDKSINKAMTAAYKYMAFELFCIPVRDMEDADKDSPEVGDAEKITPLQAGAMRKYLAELEVSEAGACGYVGAEKLEDLTVSQYSKLNLMLQQEKKRRAKA